MEWFLVALLEHVQSGVVPGSIACKGYIEGTCATNGVVSHP